MTSQTVPLVKASRTARRDINSAVFVIDNGADDAYLAKCASAVTVFHHACRGSRRFGGNLVANVGVLLFDGTGRSQWAHSPLHATSSSSAHALSDDFRTADAILSQINHHSAALRTQAGAFSGTANRAGIALAESLLKALCFFNASWGDKSGVGSEPSGTGRRVIVVGVRGADGDGHALWTGATEVAFSNVVMQCAKCGVEIVAVLGDENHHHQRHRSLLRERLEQGALATGGAVISADLEPAVVGAILDGNFEAAAVAADGAVATSDAFDHSDTSAMRRAAAAYVVQPIDFATNKPLATASGVVLVDASSYAVVGASPS